jgi:excisionase family DNA binding protein
MQIIDLEISKELSDVFFNPRVSSLFHSNRIEDSSRRGHRNGLPGQHQATRETYEGATRPLGRRQKRRSPGVYSWSSSVSDPKSLADQIESYPHALKASELAQLLSISRITVFKLAKSGRIPSFRVGTCVRFDPRKVAEWLRKM